MFSEKVEEKLNMMFGYLMEDFRQNGVPDFLYQYTDVSALGGIIEHDKLWATHYRYLNDKKELEHGLHLASSFAKESLDIGNYKGELIKSFLRDLTLIFEDAEQNKRLPLEGTDVYSISFTTEKDLLSQWRGYGKKYKSVCIGFNCNEISSDLTTPNCSYHLRKVVYDPEKQKELVYGYLSRGCEVVKTFEENYNEENFIKLKIDIFTGLVELILCFKEACWSEEKEWRILAVSQKDGYEDVSFRESDYGLVPYMKLPLFKNGNALEAMFEIMLPKSENYLRAKKSVEMLIEQKKKNYVKIEVKESDISIVY